MRTACIGLALVMTACGTADAVVEPPPAPLPVPSVSVPSPPPVAPPPAAPPVVPPPAPPPAPRGSIQASSVYPALDVSEWTLPNGAVVVYKQVPEAEAYALRAFARGGWTSFDAPLAQAVALAMRGEASGEAVEPILTATERRIEGRADDPVVLLQHAADLFAQPISPARRRVTAVDALDGLRDVAVPPRGLDSLFADPGAFTFIVVGPGEDGLVESAAGRVLTPLQPSGGFDVGRPRASEPLRVAGTGEDGVLDLAIRIPARAGDAAPLAVLREALGPALGDALGGSLEVDAALTPWADAAWLRVLVLESEQPPEAVEARVRQELSGDALFVSRARRTLLRAYRSPTPEHWLDALAQLYREGDGRQPGRDPSTLVPLSSAISRVTDSDVLTLARRFAASTDVAVITFP